MSSIIPIAIFPAFFMTPIRSIPVKIPVTVIVVVPVIVISSWFTYNYSIPSIISVYRSRSCIKAYMRYWEEAGNRYADSAVDNNLSIGCGEKESSDSQQDYR
jgi:hypothetical protein